jgi:hypothetical protein
VEFAKRSIANIPSGFDLFVHLNPERSRRVSLNQTVPLALWNCEAIFHWGRAVWFLIPLAVEIFFENDDSRKNNIIGKCINLVLFKEGVFYLFLATGFFYFCPILAHAG